MLTHRFLRLSLAWVFPSVAMAAPTIPNPSFETDTFGVSQGYISQNTPITGWTSNDDDHIGQNPAGGDNLFADNGAVPHGTRVAFIQSVGATSTLSTTITGLVPGTEYALQFRANSRIGGAPQPTCRINGGDAEAFTVLPQVGGTNAYYTITRFFTATATTAALEISNTSLADSTVLIDDFKIFASGPAMQVLNANNDGPGSLRQVLAAAKASLGSNAITFAPALNGQTIELLSEIVIDDTLGVTIDASALAKGLTLKGNGTNRLLSTAVGTRVMLRQFTLTGGGGSGADSSGNGGAIHNRGTLTLEASTVSGNTATNGGGISNQGFLTMTRCTLSGNTVSGGFAEGAGLQNNTVAQAVLSHCTLTTNSADYGGGITNRGALSVANCLVASNSASSATGGRDIDNYGGTVTRVGANVIEALEDGVGGSTNGPAAIVAPALVDALADNGGATKTHALQASSQARNASVGSTITSDQRGRPIQGAAADIGAYEMQKGTFSVFAGPGLPGVSGAESNGTSTAIVKRLDGLEGTVTVDAATLDITATAGSDYTAKSETLTFTDGVDEKYFTVTRFNDSEVEPNETFAVQISNPSADTSLGSRTRAHFTMVDPSNGNSMEDGEDPGTPVISFPAANAVLNVDVGGTVLVQGSASDNSGIQGIQVQMLTAGALPSVLTYTDDEIAAATQSDWSIPVTPVAGLNTLQVFVRDGVNRVTTVTRSFKVRRPLKVQLVGNGSVTSGFAPVSYRDVGSFTTITATPVAGHLFTGWTATGPSLNQIGVTTAQLLQPKLSFTFREGLVLRANFVANPFVPTVAGIYNGGITPNSSLPTLSALDTEGYASFTVKSTGAFTGTLRLDGAAVPVSGMFDGLGVARFGALKSSTLTLLRKDKPALSVVLNLDVTPPLSNKITGTISFLDGSGRQADISADRASFSATNLVPTNLLGVNRADQLYTTLFKAKTNVGYTADQFPQGSGTGGWKLTRTGNLTLTATLADGTAFSASTTLSASNTWRLYAPLYKGKGVVAGSAEFFSTSTVDLLAIDTFWTRPVQDTQHYPAGWPQGIRVDMGGAYYTVTPGTSIVPGLTVGGLATLRFSQGGLSFGQPFDVNYRQ